MPAVPIISARAGAVEEDPMLGFNFMLELDGALAGYFTECSGVGSENEIVEHKVVDKGGHEIVRKIPGRLKFTDISLKRGITSDLAIFIRALRLTTCCSRLLSSAWACLIWTLRRSAASS